MPPKTVKRNLSSLSNKNSNKKAKYLSLSEDAYSHPEVLSPPPVTNSSQLEHISTHISMEPPPTTKLHIYPLLCK